MAEGHSMTVADVVAQVRDGRVEDFVREAVALVARELMESEISGEVGAETQRRLSSETHHRRAKRYTTSDDLTLSDVPLSGSIRRREYIKHANQLAPGS